MPNKLSKLFSPVTIRGQKLKNRIFSTGHMAVMLENNAPSEQMVAYHQARAAGGAGLIIIEASRIHESGVSSRPAIMAFQDDCIDGYRKIAQTCHLYECKVFGQLNHPGREMEISSDGTLPVAYAPSAIPNERFHVMPRELPIALIGEIISGFGKSTQRMSKAGLDGVELVASHGYLLSQFLNPRINRRTDQYGGDLNARLRIIREILQSIRTIAGEEIIVGIRISADDKDHQGLTTNEILDIVSTLDKEGILDYFNVTAGTSAGLAGSVHIVPPMAIESGYIAPLAGHIKKYVSVPVLVAGRINQPQIAEKILTEMQADMCGMTRALICDPKMPEKAREGRFDDIRACVACNQACIGHMLKGYPISCIQHPETGRELEFGQLKPIKNRRRVIVAGGGPGGMKAAVIAAMRGHDVTLYEASSKLGGQVKLAQLLPGRSEFGGIITNLQREMEIAGVKVELNKKVTAQLIDDTEPDVVIISTGAGPYHPHIEGEEDAHVVDAWQVLNGEANVGNNVLIADWRADWIGMGLAEKFIRDGCCVRLAVNGNTAGQMIPQYTRDKWLGELYKLGVEIIPYVRLYGVDKDTVYLQNTISEEAVIFENIDTLVLSLGHKANTELESALSDWQGEQYLIGDCLAPRTVEEAILEGLKIGSIV
ncbi:MAG: FAD-dependent oxidoreductase [Gammaproteobacteria bacterium]|nr:FAD-dependent oxidoreductase [Gammaproteobacteria bacterium]